MTGTRNFGDRLIQFRKSKGLSQGELAELLGTTYIQIGRYERNDRLPSSAFLFSLLSEFPDLDAEWIMRGAGSMLKTDTPLSDESIKGVILEKLENLVSEIKRL